MLVARYHLQALALSSVVSNTSPEHSENAKLFDKGCLHLIRYIVRTFVPVWYSGDKLSSLSIHKQQLALPKTIQNIRLNLGERAKSWALSAWNPDSRKARPKKRSEDDISKLPSDITIIAPHPRIKNCCTRARDDGSVKMWGVANRICRRSKKMCKLTRSFPLHSFASLKCLDSSRKT